MKKYLIHIITLSIVMVLATFALQWFNTGYFLAILPLMVLFITILTGGLHCVIVSNMKKDLRQSIRNFFMMTIGTMIVHFAVIFFYALTHMNTVEAAHNAKVFILVYCIYFFVYLIFETFELIHFVKSQKQ